MRREDEDDGDERLETDHFKTGIGSSQLCGNWKTLRAGAPRLRPRRLRRHDAPLRRPRRPPGSLRVFGELKKELFYRSVDYGFKKKGRD